MEELSGWPPYRVIGFEDNLMVVDSNHIIANDYMAGVAAICRPNHSNIIGDFECMSQLQKYLEHYFVAHPFDNGG